MGRRQEGRIERQRVAQQILVALLLIVLATVIIPRYLGTSGSRVSKTQSGLRVLGDALERYHLDVGSFPSTQGGLAALASAPAGTPKWHGPYVRQQIPTDEWGRPFIYELVSKAKYRLISYGADGKPGGAGYDEDLEN